MPEKRGNFADDFNEAFTKGLAKASKEFEKEKDNLPKYDIKPLKKGTGGFNQPDEDGILP
jgi:hypothetical protein